MNGHLGQCSVPTAFAANDHAHPLHLHPFTTMGIIETIYEERWLVLAGLALVYLAHALHVHYRLSAFKGPLGVGFSEFPHSRRLFSMTASRWYEEVANKYGPIARIGPNSLITSHPDVWTHIHLKPGYKRSDWFYQAARWEYQKDTVFSQTDNGLHDLRRKQLAPGVSRLPRH